MLQDWSCFWFPHSEFTVMCCKITSQGLRYLQASISVWGEEQISQNIQGEVAFSILVDYTKFCLFLSVFPLTIPVYTQTYMCHFFAELCFCHFDLDDLISLDLLHIFFPFVYICIFFLKWVYINTLTNKRKCHLELKASLGTTDLSSNEVSNKIFFMWSWWRIQTCLKY